MKYADLHLHAFDQFDSQNNPDEVCIRMQELGAVGFALTQHGTLSGIEPMRKAAAKHGLKFVPGIETYYGNEGDVMKNKHLLLLARDITGYKAISMAVSDSQNDDGYAVMNDEVLARYFGPGGLGHEHVIATSACIQGPLAAVLRQNEILDKEIGKLERRYQNSLTDMSERLADLSARLDELSSELEVAKTARDRLKKLSETKFAAREKRMERLKEKDDPAYQAELESLEADKAAAKEAAPLFEEKKAEVAKLLRRQTIARQEHKEVSEIQSRYEEFNRKKEELEKSRISKKRMREGVKSEAAKLLELFGEGHFYVEVQYHGIPKEKEVYPVLAEVAREMGIPIVATNDVHIVKPTEEERLRRQILRSLRFGTAFEDEGEGDAELYIKTDEELAEWLRKILDPDIVSEAILNIQAVFNRCDVVFPEGEKHYPKFRVPDGMTAEDYMDGEVQKGIAWRFPGGLPEGYQERLDRELSVIKSMGYVDYHLIVQDVLKYGRVLSSFPEDMIEKAPLDIEEAESWVRQNNWQGGIAVGPGRGSAGGSLVCYLLGITSIDPIKYNLKFERFLNPERVSMPDIDSDFAKAVRPRIIQYVQHCYGENAVCGIMTMNAQAPRGTIRIATKFYGLKTAGNGVAFYNLGDQMSKQVPNDVGLGFDDEVSDGNTLYEMLSSAYSENSDALEILRWAKVLEGSFTTYGAHAAGIVISDNSEVKEYVPLRWNKKLGEWTTQIDMVTVEERGLLKMDFLGLKTLDVLTDTIRAIHKRTGIVIDPDAIPLDDDEAFRKIFQEGRTDSVFQLESQGMKSMLKRFKPDKFSDLILLVAAYRPGPLQYLDGVISVKTAGKPVEYSTPLLKDILDVTYGYPIYQEQVMEIFQKLAGYTLGGADEVRRAMSKKKTEKLAKEREAFINGDEKRGIDGCVKRGVDRAAANELFDQLMEFSRYAFNKSHATAYAILSYWTGWLKCHYPAEFLMAAMNEADTDEAVRGLMRETKHFGVPVLPPDINRSEADYAVTDGKILYGLSSIKAVGETGSMILTERQAGGPYTSLKDFFVRTQTKKNAVENLIKAGAMDAFCKNRKAMLSAVETYKTLVKRYLDKADFVRSASALLTVLSEFKSEKDVSRIQAEYGLSFTKVPTEKQLASRIETARQAADEAWEALGEIILPTDLNEPLTERMAAEHEMLGAYVTAHPLDDYEAGDVEATNIDEMTADTTSIFGIITDLKLKTRKSDGKPMAFFTLEDKTGTVEVAVFTKQYVACAKHLKDGNIVCVNGHSYEEVSSVQGEDGQPVTTMKFYADAMTAPKPARRVTLIVSSYAVFHVDKEEEFRKKYETKDGFRLVVYDQALDVMREMKYRVSEEVLKLKNAV